MTETGTGFTWTCFGNGGNETHVSCLAEKSLGVTLDSLGGKGANGVTGDIFVSLAKDPDTGKRNVIDIKKGEKLNLPGSSGYQAPTMTGYSFEGWYTLPPPNGSTGYGTNGNEPPPRDALGDFDPLNPPLYGGTGSKREISGISAPTITDNVTYYARWKAVPKVGKLILVYQTT